MVTNLINTDAICNLNERESSPLLVDLEDSKFRDDEINAALAGQRQRASLEDLMVIALGAVLHRHNDLYGKAVNV